MIKPGLVSITFRNLTPEEIIEACLKADVKGIEWGGDIHVPHGDLDRARRVGEMTREAGLEVASYGSYFRFDSDEFAFFDVLETAKALGAPLIRVWAGKKNSQDADPDYYRRIVHEARKAGDLCRNAGIDLAFEYHGNTLTNTAISAKKLLDDIDHRAVFSYWQPPVGMSMADCLEGIDLIEERLKWIHVFHWGSLSSEKFPLKEGRERWEKYFRRIDRIGGDRWAMLEFVKDGTIDQFLQDAAELKSLSASYE